MVQLTRIVTKGGDKGKTSLGDGTRLLKSHARIEAIGQVDEANAHIGLVRLEKIQEFDGLLAGLQNDLFDLGADLCMPDLTQSGLRVTQVQVDRLEAYVDQINESLNPLTSFVLPGGSPASAKLHLARTVVRRAERCVVLLNQESPLNPYVIQYLNRLSDLLFIMARACNLNGQADVLWVPGGETT